MLLVAIKNVFNIDPECQRLVFNGHPLIGRLDFFWDVDLKKKLTNYKISNGDKLILLTKAPSKRINFEALLRIYLRKNYSHVDPDVVVPKFMNVSIFYKQYF